MPTVKSLGRALSQKRLFSIKELVDSVGATDWFWRTQIWDGALPFVQVGKKIFIDSKDIDNFINTNKHINN
ncbi:MAG: DNA-binding protein [Proteobacteria bacterium]|nr:DNA-binding protein [Pseudomonadota bacterium]